MLSVGAYAITAQAADLGGMKDDYVPVARGNPFAGFYVGGYGGLGGASFSGALDSDEIFDDTPEDAEIFHGDFSNGGIYGGYIGYNVVRSGWLFGLELDAGSGDLSAFTQDDDGDDNAEQELRWMGSARVRLGALIDDYSLLYVTGGIGYLSTRLTARNDLDDEGEVGSKNISSVGFIGGLGFEHMFGDHLGVRLEGLYMAPANNNTLRDGELTGDIDNGDFVKVDGVYQLRAGLTYHF
jgi:opacity protein-like surface antigen